MQIRNALRRTLCQNPLVDRVLVPREKRELLARKRENFARCDAGVAAALPRLDSTPLQLQLELTNHCNIKCVMCPRLQDPRWIEHVPGHEGTMSLETFRKLEPILPRVVKCLLYGNGEPLMTPHLRAILTLLKENAINVSFNSNGLILNEDYARFFVEIGVDNITFSIDGATAETYNAIRLGSDFDRVTSNIRRLRELRSADPRRKRKPFITIACVLMSTNVHEVAGMVDLSRDLGAGVLHFEPLMWTEDPGYRTKVYEPHRLSHVPVAKIEAYFEEASARARRAGVKIVGPYVDSRGRFRAESLREFDPTVRS